MYLNIFSNVLLTFSIPCLPLRDGLISKDEMIAYFLRANPLLQCKMGPGFIHNFQEMTYLKPTFCEHCAGFVCIFHSVFSSLSNKQANIVIIVNIANIVISDRPALRPHVGHDLVMTRVQFSHRLDLSAWLDDITNGLVHV